VRRTAEEGVARRRWTVTPHIDCAGVADELQLRSLRRFGKFGVHSDRSRCGRGRNRHRDNGGARRQFPLVYVQIGIEIVVVMDGRTVLMSAVLRVVRNGVNVEGERLNLERVQGQDDEDRQAASHRPSLCHGPAPVNAAAYATGL